MKKGKAKSQVEHTAEPSAPFPFWHIGLILAVGILARIIYDWQYSGSLFFGIYQLDDLVIHSWALDIAKGISPDTAFFRAPLYPYIIAKLYTLFSDSIWPVLIFQNILGLLTAVTAYCFARRVFDSRVALWAGLIVVVYPTLIIYEGELLNTTLEVFLYTLTLYLMYESVTTVSLRWTIAAGIALGLAAICRPVILPFALVFPVILFFQQQRKFTARFFSASVCFAIAVFIPILPVTITNLTKGHEFVLISTQGGANFYVGNNAKADGVTVVALAPNRRIGKYNDNIWTSSVDQAEARTGKTMTQSEVSSYWFNETLTYMFSHPVAAFTLLTKKFYLVFHGQEIINIRSLYYSGEYSWLMKILLWDHGLKFPSGLLFPLMFAGIIFAIQKKKPVMLPLTYIIIIACLIAAFFACSRFRQPLIPVAAVFAAYAICSWIDGIRKKQQLTKSPLIIALAGCVLCNWGADVDSSANRAQFQAFIADAYLRKETQPPQFLI